MDWLELLQILGVIVAVGVALGAGVGGFFYAFKSKSNKLLREQNEQLKTQIEQFKTNYEACQNQHSESLKLIHNLEGQIQMIKDIPLNSIATGIDDLSKSNHKILETLQATSIINVQDRDVLTNSNKHIKTEVNKVLKKKGVK